MEVDDALYGRRCDVKYVERGDEAVQLGRGGFFCHGDDGYCVIDEVVKSKDQSINESSGLEEGDGQLLAFVQ